MRSLGLQKRCPMGVTDQTVHFCSGICRGQALDEGPLYLWFDICTPGVAPLVGGGWVRTCALAVTGTPGIETAVWPQWYSSSCGLLWCCAHRLDMHTQERRGKAERRCMIRHAAEHLLRTNTVAW